MESSESIFATPENKGLGSRNLENEANFQEIAAENFQKWNDLLQTGDPKKVAEIYTDDGTFLPTVSGDFKKGPNGAEEYFKKFLEKNPRGEITESVIQKIDGNHFLHSGKYDFKVGPKDQEDTLHARFTFLWKLDENGDWKIAHHHSSFIPEDNE